MVIIVSEPLLSGCGLWSTLCAPYVRKLTSTRLVRPPVPYLARVSLQRREGVSYRWSKLGGSLQALFFGFGFEGADLCLLITAVRHGEIERARLGHKQRCSSTLRSVDFADRAVGVGILLLEDANGAPRFHGSPPYENERTRPVLTGIALSLPASFPRIYNDSIYNFETSEDLWRTFEGKCS
jgi:hypothetical protein